MTKDAINNHPEVSAFAGLSSTSGPGIAQAMEELDIAPGKITVICHDRNDKALEYIQDGYIQASLANKTAMQAYLAIGLLEMYTVNGFSSVPISADNAASHLNVFPKVITTGNVVITEDNVENFIHDNMGDFETRLYHQ